MTARKHRFAVFFAAVSCATGVAFSGACGSTVESRDGGDAAPDTFLGGPDAATDSRGDARDVNDVTDALPRRCFGATYTSAPDGGVCDPSRFERSGSFEGPCLGPGVGAFCDRIFLTVS